MNDRAAGVIALIVILALLCFAAFAAYLDKVNPPPMTGYIDGKSYHPAYYPADESTPWVYALGITSEDGQRATTWKVDKETYDRYVVGQHVERWVR